MVKFIEAPSCIGCAHHQRWSKNSNYAKIVTEFDKCVILKGKYASGFISTALKGMEVVNPSNCKMKIIRETIKSNRMWVHLYFKGRENEPVVVEKGKHEIIIEAGWWVRTFFGVADRFHQWQDARAIKKAEKLVEKRKTILLTHIVKELPRV